MISRYTRASFKLLDNLKSCSHHLNVSIASSSASSEIAKSSIEGKGSGASIYALSSGANQRCGVAIVRLSGKYTQHVLTRMTNKSINDYEPRKMYLKNIVNPLTNEKIDRGLVVWFKSPNSFTGEDLCEFHVHGGPAVVQALLNALSTFKSLRYAEPGEFSRRAFMNGQMDLVEIEGLGDLINAETEMQRKQALAQMEGSLSKMYTSWRETIIKCLANAEAFIDFYEEENLEGDLLDEVDTKVRHLVDTIQHHLDDNRNGERLRNGAQVVIIGQPNAGKSSLLNTLCLRPAAIVSPIPGTTRDIIESAINIAGFPVVLNDTAGLRSTDDQIEIEGVRRAFQRLEQADLLVIVIDLSQHINEIVAKGFHQFINDHINDDLNMKQIENLNAYLSCKEILVAFNKKDLLDEKQLLDLKRLSEPSQLEIDMCKQANMKWMKNVSTSQISCMETNDLTQLIDQLTERLKRLCSNSTTEMPSLTQQRHRDNLTRCVDALNAYLTNMNREQDLAIVVEELRQAAKWLGMTTGHISTEQVLDIIFKDFCIGK